MNLQQFFALLWKCWILRKRHYISTAFEFILPLFTSVVIVVLFATNTSESFEKFGISKSGNSSVRTKPPTIYYSPTFDFNNAVRNHKRQFKLLYSPENKFTDSLRESINEVFSKFVSKDVQIDFKAFKDETSLIAYHLKMNQSQSNEYAAFIIADNKDSLRKFEYTIRLGKELSADNQKLFPFKTIAGPLKQETKYRTLFAPLQILINEAYLKLVAKSNPKFKQVNTANVLTYKLPYPKYNQRPSSSLIDMIPFVLIYGFIVTCPIIVKRIIDEKVNRSREMFRLMGLNDFVYWSSHFANYMIPFALQSLILTALYMAKFNGYIALINHSNFLIVYVFFLLYGASFILMSILISIPFRKPVIGVITAVNVWMVTYMLPLYFVDPIAVPDLNVPETETARILSCLLPNVGLNFGFRLISQSEIYGYGTNFDNIHVEQRALGNLSVLLVFGMFVASCLISIVLIWYLDAVWPFQEAAHKPLYFPCLPSYWRKKRSDDTKIASARMSISEGDGGKFYEKQMSNSEVCVSVRNLRKEFGFGAKKKTAVKNVSLNINHGQITVLLGHNGAGKTTTMNMITSIFPPSSGMILVNGYNVVNETKAARRSMSLCPQHNILYNELTVAEHLKLYARIKGMPSKNLQAAVNRIAEQLQLTAKLNNASMTLSGGMKRKLCLGIALIGDTKVVILDEPTSGLDPNARRIVWDLLHSIRNERTILLTTHYMEEADALGDRIAIMSSGEVKCCGTPMYLKKLFGTGYQLRIAKGENYKGDAIFKLVCNFFPAATVTNNIETEIIYCLGEEHTSETLLNFFERLEYQKGQLGITSCGLAATTIEDVFLGVNSLETLETETSNVLLPQSSSTEQLISDSKPVDYQRLSGIRLQLQRLKGLLLKRVHFTKRCLPMFYFQLLIPCLMFLMLLLLDRYLKTNKLSMSKLKLNLYNMYGSTVTVIDTKNMITTDKFDKYYNDVARSLKASVKLCPTKLNISTFVITQAGDMNVNVYIKSYLTALSFSQQNDAQIYNVWYNNEAIHSLPASINLLYNTLLRAVTQNSSDYSITVNHDPLPNKNQFFFEFIMVTVLRLMWAIIIPMSIPFLAASYVYFPVHEKQTKSKLLQFMTGLHPSLYWFSNYLFDITTHLICSCLIIMIFLAVDCNQVFIGHCESMISLFFLLFCFGLSSIPFAYIVSFIPKTPSSGFALLVILFLISGVILCVIDFLLKLGVGNSISETAYDCFSNFARTLPLISFTKGVVKLYESGTKSKLCNRLSAASIDIMCKNVKKDEIFIGCCKGKCHESRFGCFEWQSPLVWGANGVLEEMIVMIIDAIIFITILSLMESSFKYVVCRLIETFKGIETSVLKLDPNPDSDVVDEKQSIQKMIDTQTIPADSLIVHKLTKRFKGFYAVKQLTFGIRSQECFGLLGINGAGKTSTFRMLAGELNPSDGNAYFDGCDVTSKTRAFQEKIGYCPQFDALLDKLTGKETLYLFARLRGLPENKLKTIIAEITEMVDLNAHINKKTEDYSGGNRRKLSLGIALIGSPSLLFLDEPSAGVDPQARRKLWKTLTYIRNTRNCSMVLTSHSMDECEALCSRIAIMVNGEFKCLGSIQYLRSKFGQGFTLSVKVKREKLSPEYIEQLNNHILRVFPSAIVKGYNETVIDYHITDSSVSWPYLLKTLTEIKQAFDFEDYSISDTTLEQIFLSFARQQSQQLAIIN